MTNLLKDPVCRRETIPLISLEEDIRSPGSEGRINGVVSIAYTAGVAGA